MKPRTYRFCLGGWRTRMLAALTAGSLSFAASADAQDRRVTYIRDFAQPATPKTNPAASASAMKTIHLAEATASTSRMQAVATLGAAHWQADSILEGTLIRALRADPSESVRAQTAAVFTKASYLTPRAHDALQCSSIGSSRDGFPAERAAAVKWQANEALKKHPTSASPTQIARLQWENATAKGVTLQAPAGSIVRDGSEESSPPEQSPLTLPEIVPFIPPSTGPSPAVPVIPQLPKAVDASPKATPSAVPSVVPTATATPAPATVPAPLPLAPLSKIEPPPPLPAPKTASKTPGVAPTPPPLPIRDAAVKPASVPESLPSAKIPTLPSRAAAPKVDKLPDHPPADDSNMTLFQRRTELRDMGLQDPSIRLFTQQTSAPLPTTPSGLFGSSSATATTKESPGFFKGLIPMASANEPETPRAVPGTYVSRPNPLPEADPAPKPGAWKRLAARFTHAEETPAAPVQANNDSPGFLSRILPGRLFAPQDPAPAAPQTIVPVSTYPVQR